MANKVTTEWHDIQVKMGNFTAIEKPITGEEIHQENMEIMEGFEQNKNGSDNESDPDFRDEDETESEALRKYRENRMEEMKENAGKPKFGYVKHITKEDYVIEVNEAPKDVMVVLILYQDYNEAS